MLMLTTSRTVGSLLSVTGWLVILMQSGGLFASEQPNPVTARVISSSSSELTLELQTISPQTSEPYRLSEGLMDSVGDVGNGSLRFTRWILLPPQSGVAIAENCIEFSVTDSEIGGTAELPTEFAIVGTPGILRGYRMAPIHFASRIRDPKTGEIRAMTGGNVRLTFDTSLNRVNLLDRPDRLHSSRAARRIVENMIVNPEMLPRDEPLYSGSILYVLRDLDDLEDHLQPLVEWRKRMGWTVETVRVDRHLDREAIKQAIQEVYNSAEIQPEYVVLVGDAPTQGNNQYTLSFYNVQSGGNFAYETDQPFVLLEGEDLLPDACIGRLSVTSLNVIDRMVNKAVMYESDPFIGEGGDMRGWQSRAAVIASDSRSGRSSIDICKWFKDLATENDFANVSEFYFNAQNQQPNPTQFIQTNVNGGISFLLYRGWSDMNGYEPQYAGDLRNGMALPFVMLATCNTGEYVTGNQNSQATYTERFVTNSAGGAIGAVGAAGATHTAYNNLIAAGTLSAPFINQIYSQGWALQNGKLQLMKAYAGLGDINHEENRSMEAWLTEYYIFNLMGDAAVDLFTATPTEINVTNDPSLNVGDTHYLVNVRTHNEDRPVKDARVCLYKSGVFQVAGFTGEDGSVDLKLQPSWLAQGTVLLTVTGHNLKTILEDIDVNTGLVQIAFSQIQIDDDNNGGSEGNGDGELNPTETIQFLVRLTNRGSTNPNGQMTVRLEPENDLIQLLSDPVVLESAPRRGQSVDVPFTVEIPGGFPNDVEAAFKVTSQIANSVFSGYFALPVEGPQIEFASITWSGNPMPVGGNGLLWVTLINNGSKNVAGLRGRLISLSPTVEVIAEEGFFQGMNVGNSRRSEGVFGVVCRKEHIAGNTAPMAMVVTTEAGFLDTAFFMMPVGRSITSTPFGPDTYGYVCFDDTDTGWVNQPRYDWIEINPRLGGRGTNLQLSDPSEESDASITIELPFDFQYYGEDFDFITVCSNGWAAFGDHHELITGRNRRIPCGELVPAMLAPFWDDLITPANAGVFTWFDQGNRRFIIEWSGMRRLGPQGINEPLESFQVILYDPEVRGGALGDGDILFQYLDVTDSQSCYQTWDTPFATVGIASPSRQTGLEYTYWNQRNPGAAVLRDSRAILFTTAVSNPVMYFRGTVFDAEDGEALGNVEIHDRYNASTVTDQEGRFLLGVPIRDELISLTARKAFFNDSTIAGFQPVAGDTTEVNFRLLKPVFGIDTEALILETRRYHVLRDTLTIHNSGVGKLYYSCSISESQSPETVGNLDPKTDEESVIASDWLTFNPGSDSLASGESGIVALELDPTSLDSGLFSLNLVITHNAAPGFIEIPVELTVVLGVDEHEAGLVTRFELYPAYPNPFNSQVTISYGLPKAALVKAMIVDAAGRPVWQSPYTSKQSGRHDFTWDANSQPAGIYFCRISSSNNSVTTKLLLIK